MGGGVSPEGGCGPPVLGVASVCSECRVLLLPARRHPLGPRCVREPRQGLRLYGRNAALCHWLTDGLCEGRWLSRWHATGAHGLADGLCEGRWLSRWHATGAHGLYGR